MLNRITPPEPDNTPLLLHKQFMLRAEACVETFPLFSGNILTIQEYIPPCHPSESSDPVTPAHVFRVWKKKAGQQMDCIAEQVHLGDVRTPAFFANFLPEGPVLGSLKDKIFSFTKEREFLCRAGATVENFIKNYSSRNTLKQSFLEYLEPSCAYIGDNKFVLFERHAYLATKLLLSVYEQIDNKIKLITRYPLSGLEFSYTHLLLKLFGEQDQIGLINKGNNTLFLWKKFEDKFVFYKKKVLLNKDMTLRQVLHFKNDELILLGYNNNGYSDTSWIVKINVNSNKKIFLNLLQDINFLMLNHASPFGLPLLLLKQLWIEPFLVTGLREYAVLDYESMSIMQFDLPRCKNIQLMPNGDFLLMNSNDNISGFTVYNYPRFNAYLAQRKQKINDELLPVVNRVNDVKNIIGDYLNNDIKHDKNLFKFFNGKDLAFSKKVETPFRCNIM